MRKTFCVLPFIHAVYNPYDPLTSEGHIMPCCRYDSSKGKVEKKDVKEPNKKSIVFRELQDTLKSGIQAEGCSRCWKDEELGVTSYRQGANKSYQKIIDSEEYLDRNLKFLEITPSNLCNLACRSCNSTFSSKWVPIDNYIASDRNKKSIAYTDWRTLDLSHLEELKLMGGEPMLLKDNIELLKHLDEIGSLKNIKLHIITNLMNPLTDQWKDYISKCESLYLWTSIDAKGKLNDYVRSDSKWKTIHSNLLEIKSFLEELPFYSRLSVNTVVTILNVNKTLEIEQYCETLQIKNFMDITSYPSHLDCKKLPACIKNTLISNGISEKVKDAILSVDEDPGIVDDFFHNNHILDGYHKKSFENYNQEMYNILENYRKKND